MQNVMSHAALYSRVVVVAAAALPELCAPFRIYSRYIRRPRRRLAMLCIIYSVRHDYSIVKEWHKHGNYCLKETFFPQRLHARIRRQD